MTSDLWQQVREVLNDALETPVPKRRAFLDRACAGNQELRDEVESLLETAESAEAFIEEPVSSLLVEESWPLAPGDRLGPYKILHEIGRGGMGTVLRAVRADDEFEMQVAIKVVSREKTTDDVVRRFRQERNILAALNHPYIASLFDGGTTPDGRPYFVMEYVEGQSIDRYCDDHRLSIQERVHLFRKICSAVEYAHRNLVVHRDIKPGNILVTEDGEPKLLDFGIAKILDPEPFSMDATTRIQPTLMGLQPLTLRYASPEQIWMSTITTSTDVYSLGVLLYELLTGHSPYRLRNRSMAALSQQIKETDPQRPSSVVGIPEEITSSDGATITITPESVSHTRSGDPRTLQRRLSGDLDAILLKALSKEPERRYTSVEQFSEDLRRHIEGLPVMARSGTLLYKTTKFVQRHKLKLVALAAILIIILIGSVMRLRQIDRERKFARFVIELIELQPTSAKEPEFEQRFHQAVLRAGDRQALAESLTYQAYRLEDRGGYQTAEILYREALAMKRRLFGEDHPSIAVGLNNLAAALEAQGKYEEAKALYQETLDLRVRLYGRESEEAARTLNNLAVLYQNTDELDKAEPLLRESLEIRKKLSSKGGSGSDDVQVAAALNNLAYHFQLQGSYGEAETLYLEALEITRRHTDEEKQGLVLRNLATAQLAKGDYENAAGTARMALEVFRKKLVHWRIADAESVLGGCLTALGEYEQAEPLLSRSYPVIKAAKGENARQAVEAKERLQAYERLTTSREPP